MKTMYFAPSKSKHGRTALNHLHDVRYWHRPGGAFMEVLAEMKTRGVSDPTLLDKEYMELYTASLLAMGFQKSEGLDFWVAKPLEDPPDMAFMTMLTDEKERIRFSSREVEVTRSLPSETILDTLLKKDKPYPGDYILACFLERSGVELLKNLSETLIKKLRYIDHVFLVFHGVALVGELKTMPFREAINKVSVVQLSPVYDYQVIDIREQINEWGKDVKKLAYVDGRKVFHGLRPNDRMSPRILRN